MLVTHSLTHSLTDPLLFSKLYWCDVWLVKMPTQNLLSLLLLLMLMMRNVLTTVVCRFGSWSLVINLNSVQTLRTRFGQEFEVEQNLASWPNFSFQICIQLSSKRFSSSTSTTVTTPTSSELPSSHARVTSIKFTKQELGSQWVSQWVTDKHSQWLDSEMFPTIFRDHSC